jgi:TIR domain-containing protein
MTRSDFEYDVFLSHSSKDKPAVRKLAERLKRDGVRVWLDEWKILPGDMIGLKIEEALEKSRSLILVMSENAVESDWVTLERHAAIFRDPANRHRRFIPLRLDDVDVGDMLRQFAYVDWRHPTDGEYAKLLAALRPAPSARNTNAVDEADPEWAQKLDRIEQTGAARYLVDDMLELGRPRCICFCWYGGERDGVDTFHNRLESEFAGVSKNRCWSVRPEWPGVISRPSFCEMLTHTMEIARPDDTGAAIRNHFHGRRRQLLYVNHTPVESNRRLNPHQFLEYLRWWDEAVLDYLEPQQHVILGVSFVVENPVKFRDAVERVAGIPQHPFSDRFVFELLPVLQPLRPEHLRTFFKRINMQLRADQPHQEQIIDTILDSTNGEYDLVVQELEVLFSDGFDKLIDSEPGPKQSPESDDFGY